MKKATIVDGDSHIDLERLQRLHERPAPFAPGERLFWDDPHISKMMLVTHLDPNTEAASRHPETIDKSVAWLVETLGLKAGDPIVDLGCGPGLYAVRFAQHGLRITGVDYSRRSIEYARQLAAESAVTIDFRYQDYLTLNEIEEYEAAFLIYGDFCPLAPAQRATLLANVRQALKPGGHFVLDVSTRAHRRRVGAVNGWYVVESGFWKPGRHLVLEEGFDYPEQAVYLNQASVIEEDGRLTVYRNWFQDYDPESISAELRAGGLHVESLWADLTGTLYRDDSEWIGVVARKA